MVIVIWILGSVMCAHIGTYKRIGYLESLVTCLFLSPLIGAFVAMSSPDKVDIKRQEEMLKMLKLIAEQNAILIDNKNKEDAKT